MSYPEQDPSAGATVLGYRPWRGRRRAAWWRWWPLARTGMRLVVRRRVFWVFLIFGLLNFCMHFAIIYFITNLKVRLVEQGHAGTRILRIVEEFVFTGKGDSYRDFLFLQGTVVMLFLAFSGAILIGNDFRHSSVGFYLSRPITRLHYIFGKWVAATLLTSLITLAPAVVLFLEYGAFTNSLEYYRESQRILWSILFCGFLVSALPSLLMLAVAALMERTVLIIAVWGGLFAFLPGIAALLRRTYRSLGAEDPWLWSLLDVWSVMKWLSHLAFGTREVRYEERMPWAIAAALAWAAVAGWILWRRLRAVDVVK